MVLLRSLRKKKFLCKGGRDMSQFQNPLRKFQRETKEKNKFRCKGGRDTFQFQKLGENSDEWPKNLMSSVNKDIKLLSCSSKSNNSETADHRLESRGGGSIESSADCRHRSPQRKTNHATNRN